MKKTAFVTGGTGFVGANLVRLLIQQGYQVKALVRSQSRLDNLQGLNLEILTADLNDPNLAELMKGCDYLFHVAALYSLWQFDQKLLYYNNVLGTRNVLAAAKLAGIERTVYTSSVAAIGVNKSKIADETHQTPLKELIGYYKQSKYLAEQEAYSAIADGLDIVIVNPSTPIGPFDIKPTPTGELILRFLRRQMPAYVDTGLNLIDVRDVAQGHILALEKGKSGDRYILGNENMTLQTILEKLSQITGYPAPKYKIPVWIPLILAWIDEKVLTYFNKTPSIPLDGVRMSYYSMYYHSDKAVKELGLPQTPINIALQDAVDWFKKNGFV